MGTPKPEIWPGVDELPDFKPTFPMWSAVDLHQFFPNMGEAGIDLLKKMLTYDPAYRISARKALAHPYFEERNH
ncbi:Cyclin-dependent kinase catalytic subunit [Nowakowskiella sp. JEL0078]|nr:Cyclin-dependent kinase catalytic subunit [Nowakowskiella sp. JEL0078]